jgi:mono/diheme cytochrome c family protein
MKTGAVKRHRKYRFLAGMFALILCIAANDSWLQRVPEADRQRVNLYAGQDEAIGAGKKVFLDHCAKCHGEDAKGRGKKPSLRSIRVQQAKDGEIFWLLKNGNLKKGMPTWSSLPEPTRWQVIAFVKSMGTSSAQRVQANQAQENGK